MSSLEGRSADEQKARLRDLFRTDLYALLRYGCRRTDCDNEWVFQRCREVQREPDNCLDLWFRGGYKSTIITFGHTIFDLLNDPELTFGIFSFSRPIAKQFLRQIKTEFETNQLLKDLFDDILWSDPKSQAGKWSEDDGIILKRKGNPKEATIEAWGLVDGQPTSKHFKRLVYDDVVTDSSVTTADQIKKTTRAYELSRNLTSKDSKSRYIGTRYHYFDTYDEIQKRGVKVRKYAATKDGSISGEPWFLSRDQLNMKLIEMGTETFAAQMMQEPRLEADAYFKAAWFKRYTAKPRYDTLRIYGASDFAVTKDGGDYTVHGLVGIDPDDNIFVLDVWRQRTETNIWVEAMLDMVSALPAGAKPLAWGVPRDQIANSIGPFLNKRMHERRIYLNLEEISEAGDKQKKARSIQARASMGKVYLPSATAEFGYTPPAWLADFETELLLFPLGKNDDQVDFLSLIGRMIDEMASGRKSARGDGKQDSWRSAFNRRENSSADWKTA